MEEQFSGGCAGRGAGAGRGTGAFPCPPPGSAESSLSLNENKCKTDRYICNPLPGRLYETLNSLARGGRRRLPKYFFLNEKVASDRAGSHAGAWTRPSPRA